MPSSSLSMPWWWLCCSAVTCAGIGALATSSLIHRNQRRCLRSCLLQIGKAKHERGIYLVGAGPGAADFITVRGLELIRCADVIFHDRLVAPSLLDAVRPDCVVINVGKSAKRDRYPQAEINRLLVLEALARPDAIIVRLKGGDPFVFGLGAEEVLALRAAGVDSAIHVIPGVSSALAVPGAVGVPVTHKGVSGSFTVLSGHYSPDDARAESWHGLPVLSSDRSIVDSQSGAEHAEEHGIQEIDNKNKNTGSCIAAGTLVVLMGTKQLPNIATYLIDTKGWRASTPVVVVESATTCAQTVVRGSLQDIAERVAAANVKPPSTIVIGDVCAVLPAGAIHGEINTSRPEQATERDNDSWGVAVK